MYNFKSIFINLSIISILFIFCCFYGNQRKVIESNHVIKKDLYYFLKKYASPTNGSKGFIVVAMADNSSIDMALNFYFSSIKTHSISNYLILGVGSSVCPQLRERGINCFYYKNDQASSESNDYGTGNFIRKMNIRTEFIIEILDLGFSLLHTDLDVIFIKNPLPVLYKILETKHVTILWDYLVYNAGFVAMRSSKFSSDLYKKILHLTNSDPRLDDQKALGIALKSFDFNKYSKLNKKEFMCGREFYQVSNPNYPLLPLANSCPQCIVVHNNWIISKEAKIYRFKECLQWKLDENQYYSSKERKYLTYWNPFPESEESIQLKEEESLKTALSLSYLLDRILVLPIFHTSKKKKSFLHSLYKMKDFDKIFNNKYREHRFFLNPMVPESIKIQVLTEDLNFSNFSKSFPVFIQFENLFKNQTWLPFEKVNFINLKLGQNRKITEKEIKFLKKFPHNVLNFGSFLKVKIKNELLDENFLNNLKISLKKLL